MGVGTSLIYPPASFAETDELVSLATEAGRCGGMYISHIRSEGDRLLESADELIDISRRSGAPAEFYHLKQAGRAIWNKLGQVIAKVEAARAGPPDHGRHVHLHRRRNEPLRIHAAVGSGRRRRTEARAATRRRTSTDTRHGMRAITLISKSNPASQFTPTAVQFG
uniref:hypothetical protein n=1 Tax=uncultured Sphingomonas sp. TaxID=158754 RepID=UPI0025E67698|nr:hypothetical protein [uncultured Sphingomonas sp.]